MRPRDIILWSPTTHSLPPPPPPPPPPLPAPGGGVAYQFPGAPGPEVWEGKETRDWHPPALATHYQLRSGWWSFQRIFRLGKQSFAKSDYDVNFHKKEQWTELFVRNNKQGNPSSLITTISSQSPSNFQTLRPSFSVKWWKLLPMFRGISS